jgi:hypothetical protein
MILFIGHIKLGRKSSKKNSRDRRKVTEEEDKQIEGKRREERVGENCETLILLKLILGFE